MHCDAVQALGKIPLDFSLLGADLLTLSAHKCGGPVGAAALLIKQNLAIPALFAGGGQESGRRAGTENIAAIAGFAAAIEVIDLAHMQKIGHWRDALEASLPQATFFSHSGPRLPNTSCLGMPGVGAELQLIHFDLSGFAVSAGSACSSGRVEASHVLSAMGVSPAKAATAIRVSLGWRSTQEECEQFATAWQNYFEKTIAQ